MASGNEAKAGRRKYTRREDIEIMKYVKERSRKGDVSICVSGNVLWKQMERDEVVPGRSWMSLRDRYLKYLITKKSMAKPDLSPVPLRKKCDLFDESHESSSEELEPTTSTPTRERTGKRVTLRSQFRADSTTTKREGRRAASPSTSENIASESTEPSTSPTARRVEGECLSPSILRCLGNGLTIDYGDKNCGKKEDEEERMVTSTTVRTAANSESSKNREPTIPKNSQQFPRILFNRGEQIFSPKDICVMDMVRFIRDRTNATLPQIFFSLFCTNASAKDALAFLVNKDTNNVWTLEDDKILMGRDAEAIKQLMSKRGVFATDRRIDFIEGEGETGA